MIVAITNVLILMVFCIIAGLVAGFALANRKIELEILREAERGCISPEDLKRNERTIIIEE